MLSSNVLTFTRPVSNIRCRSLHLATFLMCFFSCFVGIVQRKRIQTRHALIEAGKNPKQHSDEIMPRIHGMVFNPKDGKLKKLPIDFKRRTGSLDHIYGLY